MKLQDTWTNFLADLEPFNFHDNIMTLTKKTREKKDGTRPKEHR